MSIVSCVHETNLSSSFHHPSSLILSPKQAMPLSQHCLQWILWALAPVADVM